MTVLENLVAVAHSYSDRQAVDGPAPPSSCSRSQS